MSEYILSDSQRRPIEECPFVNDPTLVIKGLKSLSLKIEPIEKNVLYGADWMSDAKFSEFVYLTENIHRSLDTSVISGKNYLIGPDLNGDKYYLRVSKFVYKIGDDETVLTTTLHNHIYDKDLVIHGEDHGVYIRPSNQQYYVNDPRRNWIPMDKSIAAEQLRRIVEDRDLKYQNTHHTMFTNNTEFENAGYYFFESEKENEYTEPLGYKIILLASITPDRGMLITKIRPRLNAVGIVSKMLQVAKKLHKLHENGHYHCDLHPGNYVCNGDVVSLIDGGFNISREFGPEILGRSVPISSISSPEQYLVENPVLTEKSEVFALVYGFAHLIYNTRTPRQIREYVADHEPEYLPSKRKGKLQKYRFCWQYINHEFEALYCVSCKRIYWDEDCTNCYRCTSELPLETVPNIYTKYVNLPERHSMFDSEIFHKKKDKWCAFDKDDIGSDKLLAIMDCALQENPDNRCTLLELIDMLTAVLHSM